MRSDFIWNYNTQVSAKPNLNIIILSLTIVTVKLYGVPDALTTASFWISLRGTKLD